MCPLRFIVLIISGLIALLVAVWSYLQMIEEDEDRPNRRKLSQSDLEDKPWWQQGKDFLTGRYIYETYQQWKGSQLPAASQ
mmetsp:Transcript_34648/g.73985  ORF Transcript_34648/g.73985 Transcript_34648/m.73985 type:complete len:81 (-) Transcript_34648:249-491(-)